MPIPTPRSRNAISASDLCFIAIAMVLVVLTLTAVLDAAGQTLEQQIVAARSSSLLRAVLATADGDDVATNASSSQVAELLDRDDDSGTISFAQILRLAGEYGEWPIVLPDIRIPGDWSLRIDPTTNGAHRVAVVFRGRELAIGRRER